MKASEILETLDSAVPGLAMVKTKRTNLERRLGNNDKAAEIFETAIKEATDKDTGSFYSVRYSRYLAKVQYMFLLYIMFSACAWVFI